MAKALKTEAKRAGELEKENASLWGKMEKHETERRQAEDAARFDAASEQAAVPSSPSSGAGPAHARGLEAMKNKEWQSAAAYFREALKSDPNHKVRACSPLVLQCTVAPCECERPLPLTAPLPGLPLSTRRRP